MVLELAESPATVDRRGLTKGTDDTQPGKTVNTPENKCKVQKEHHRLLTLSRLTIRLYKAQYFNKKNPKRQYQAGHTWLRSNTCGKDPGVLQAT